jgi:peptidoglycan/LPS O-acetylase OafA/YrhL
LQGVRALAVIVVILFHANLPYLTGGFIGVDVFFVLSGYFITGILVRELSRTGKISIRGFYGRRVRRILPASSLVLCVTTVLLVVFTSPLMFKQTAREMFLAGLSSVNFLFAKDSVDYFAPNMGHSPVLHFWSLAVEEQFYIFFPSLLVLLTLLGRRFRQSAFVLFALVAIAVMSFLISLKLTNTIQPSAFFLLPSRAWELGVGAIIAVSAKRFAVTSKVASSAMQVLGIGLVFLAAFALDSRTAFPGVAAVAPVLGTALIILANPQSAILTPLLSNRFAQAVGRWSYSLYLWHWPLLTIVWVRFSSHSVLVNSLVVTMSVVLAALTYRYWENPIRLKQYFMGHRRGAQILMVSIVVAPLVCAATLLSKGLDSKALTVAVKPATEAVIKATIMDGLKQTELPKELSPQLPQAAKDAPETYSDGCHVRDFASSKLDSCVFGTLGSRNSIWLIGDSHAAQWFPAMQAIAIKRHAALTAVTKSACPPVLNAIPDPVNPGKNYDACLRYNRKVLERANVEKPDLIVISGKSDLVAKAGSRGLQSYLQALPTESRIVYLEDTPNPTSDVPQCVTTPLRALAKCDLALDSQWAATTRAISEQVSQAQASYLPVHSWLCYRNVCPAVAGNVLVYRDDSHISTTAAYWLSGLLGRELFRIQSKPIDQ